MNATKKLTMADVKRLAKKIGCEVSDDRGIESEHCHYIDAPVGKLIAHADLHMVVLVWDDNIKGDKQKAIASALDDMSRGIEDCDRPDCEYCRDQRLDD